MCKTAVLTTLLMILACSSMRADNPSGSYQQTCRNISVSGSTLSASCENRGGGWQSTTLSDYQQCIGDIQNLNGSLQCSKGTAPPSGSYKQSCRDVFMTGTTLNATCQNRGGGWIPASLSAVNQCIGDISNYDGVLRCSTGAAPPGGSYSRSCRDIFMNGTTLNASCNNGSGTFVNRQLRNVDVCRSEIYNFLGELTCVTGTGNAPPGSFIQTCGNVIVNGDALTAICITRNGTTVSTSFSGFNTCRSPVTNIDGFLTCNRGTGDPPPGTYQQTCIDIIVNGPSITADCETSGGTLVKTSLASTNNCADISNKEGTLTCITAVVPPSISVSSSGHAGSSTFSINGSLFQPGSLVTLFVVDDALNRPIANKQMNANPRGEIKTTWSFSCNSTGILAFRASDGRTNPQDPQTNQLFSNTVRLPCP
jgi:hypothetical protein